MFTKQWFCFIFYAPRRTRVLIKYTICSTHARTHAHTQTTVEIVKVPSYSRHPNFAFLALDTLLCLRILGAFA